MLQIPFQFSANNKNNNNNNYENINNNNDLYSTVELPRS